jgi:LacI family transcriptional regulator
MKRITIKDIARELGVHHSTVSRALRSHSEINAATREKVVKYALGKGYQINRNALHLRGVRSNIIGVIVPNIDHSFFSNFVSIFTRLAFTSGYIVAVFQSEESVEQEKEIIKSIIQQNIAGVISSLSMETTDVSHFQQLDRYKIPLVCFDRINSSLLKSTVVLDNESTLKNVVLKLNSKGYTKIAYLSGIPSINLFQERQNGYYLGLKKIKTPYEKCISITDGFTVERGFEVTKQLFNERVKPDALIFDSHILAWGALSYLKAQTGRLLENTGIASFGGYPWLSLTAPNMLFIQQPEEKIARASFELLREAIFNPSDKNIKTLKFQAKLI